MGEEYKDTWNRLVRESGDINAMASINDKIDQTILNITPYIKMIYLAKYKESFYPKNINNKLVKDECVNIILKILK